MHVAVRTGGSAVAAVAATAVAVAAVALTACASVAPAASEPRPHPVSGKPVAAGSITTITAPRAGSPAEAAALARNMLSKLHLPAGSRRVPATPVQESLRRPLLWGLASASLDLHRLFELPLPMQTAAAVLAAHVPAGMTLALTSSYGGNAGTISQYVSYQLRSVPAAVHAAQLALTVVADNSGGALLRADAQVSWYPPRTAAEYIDPVRYHVLTIAVTIYNPRLHTIRKVVTSPAAIRRLAGVLDRSRVNPGKTISCALIFAEYRLAFAVSVHSSPAVVVTASQWPCEGAQVRVDGRMQPSLQDAAGVVAVADHLLGVTPRP